MPNARPLLSAAIVVCSSPGLLGAGYPDRPIRIVVPYPPGSVTDNVARPLANRLAAVWGQPVIVDNRPGAGGNVGAEIVARSVPDGYTLLAGSQPPNAVNASLYRKVPFDAVRDFAPIALAATTHQLLVVHPTVPVATVQELIALLRARPGQLNYGSSGNGSSPHLATELFKYMTGTSMNHVPYKGSPQYTFDIVAGRIDVVFAAIGGALPHVRTGKLRLLGVSAPARDTAMPDFPAIGESVPGYDMRGWYGFLAAAGTPARTVQLLNAEILRFLALPETRAQFAASGLLVAGSTPAEFSTWIRQEVDRWAKVVKAVGIQVD